MAFRGTVLSCKASTAENSHAAKLMRGGSLSEDVERCGVVSHLAKARMRFGDSLLSNMSEVAPDELKSGGGQFGDDQSVWRGVVVVRWRVTVVSVPLALRTHSLVYQLRYRHVAPRGSQIHFHASPYRTLRWGCAWLAARVTSRC